MKQIGETQSIQGEPEGETKIDAEIHYQCPDTRGISIIGLSEIDVEMPQFGPLIYTIDCEVCGSTHTLK